MARLELRPDHFTVLKAIQQNGPILVTELDEKLELDRGAIEAAIGSLSQDNHIERKVETTIYFKLTKRGKEAAKGLAERKIIEVLLKNPVHMKDVGVETGLSKGDVTAGIGILRKNDLIEINKGEVKLKDKKKSEAFSADLEQTLNQLEKGDGEVKNQDIVARLKSRGFVEEHEENRVIVSTKYTKKKLDNAIVKEEITKLTPKMIADGSWKNVNLKPYSLKTKPRVIHAGKYQPYRDFVEHLKRKLIGLGFKEMKGPIIEQEFWNFDALYAAQDHPAREDSDILLLKEPTHGKLMDKPYVQNVAHAHEDGWKTGSTGYGYKWDPRKAARLLLRPQGTSISARTLAHVNPPEKYFSVARCYRPDQVDATHAIEFHQTEGIICAPDITFRDLLGMLKTFAVEVAGAEKVRFRPDFYPFTSPSVELSAKHPVLGYIEFGGAGMFRPEVTQPFGIEYPVLAWGLGVERLFMTKYEIEDIREIFSQNLEWLRTEKVSSGIGVGDH